MATLGEAFIEVKADLKPFTQNLKREVKEAVAFLEKNLGKGFRDTMSEAGGAAGRRASENFSDEFEESTRRRFGRRGEKKPWYVAIAGALASALDDGISALPTEVKAAIVGGIIVALPIVSGALAGAVSAGLGLGLAGLGVLLAFQFEEVRNRATAVFGQIRQQLVTLARPFLVETLNMLDRIGQAFVDWGPRLTKIFTISSGFLEPLTRGLLGMFDAIVDSLADVSDDLQPFVDTLSDGFQVLGLALGEFLELMVSTGEDGRVALQDLIYFTAQLLVNLGYLIKFLAEVWGWIHKISQTMPFLLGSLGIYLQQSDAAFQSTELYGSSLGDLNHQIEGTIAKTDAQTRALKETAQALDTARDAAFSLIDATVNYEEAIDRLDETLKENGKTLDVTGEKGRENIRAFTAAFKAAQKQAEDYYAQGKLNSGQARAFYEQEVAEIMEIARQRGVNVKLLQQTYADSLALINLPPESMPWLMNSVDTASDLVGQLQRAYWYSTHLGNVLPSSGTRPFSEFAEGGIVDGPEAAIVGEAGPEVIIPLTKPRRAAELAMKSGLLAMLTPKQSTDVYVYVGNEAIDQRMVRVVERNNSRLSQSLAYGAR